MVQEGQTFLHPGMSDNQSHTITDVGEGESGEFGAMAGEGEVRVRPSIPSHDSIMDVDTLKNDIDPKAIHRRRSENARVADNAKDAELTTDPLQWASDPSQYDFPGVDTGPQFRKVEGNNFDTDSFLDFL